MIINKHQIKDNVQVIKDIKAFVIKKLLPQRRDNSKQYSPYSVLILIFYNSYNKINGFIIPEFFAVTNDHFL